MWRCRLSACYKQRSSGLSVCGWGARDAHAHSIIPKVAYARVHSYERDRLHVNVHTYVAATSPPRKHRDACYPPPRFALLRPGIPYPASQTRYFIHARIVRPGLFLFTQVPRTFCQLSYTCTTSNLRHLRSTLSPIYHVHSFHIAYQNLLLRCSVIVAFQNNSLMNQT